jgi:hypothetical protein
LAIGNSSYQKYSTNEFQSFPLFHRSAPFQWFNGSVTARNFASKPIAMSFVRLPPKRKVTRAPLSAG